MFQFSYTKILPKIHLQLPEFLLTNFNFFLNQQFDFLCQMQKKFFLQSKSQILAVLFLSAVIP